MKIGEKRLESFIEFCVERHDIVCNQKYAGALPYSCHLKWVASNGKKFLHLIDEGDRNLAIAGCYGHDLIEDARMTYNDIKQLWGFELAEIIYACSEEKGRTRSERHSADFFMNLSTNDIAIFVKLCDIAANVKFSMLDNSSMLVKYQLEFGQVKDYLYTPKYEVLFEYIEKLLKS
jgi:(p)ppGpp synthase/HD superfamily hydrolase